MATKEEIKRRIQRIRGGGLLDEIRVRTAMYTGERTLSALHHFFDGYQMAQDIYQVPPSQQSRLPSDFHDWFAYRLHFRESTSGYRRMILQNFPDESMALDRFFELLDEHQTRQARVVATVRCHPSDPDVFTHEQGDLKNKRRLRVAENIKLVVYTDDPGFFETHDDPAAEHPRKSSFCPALSWSHYLFRPDTEYLTVLDREQYDRLLREDLIFRQRLREESDGAKRRFEKKRVN